MTITKILEVESPAGERFRLVMMRKDGFELGAIEIWDPFLETWNKLNPLAISREKSDATRGAIALGVAIHLIAKGLHTNGNIELW